MPAAYLKNAFIDKLIFWPEVFYDTEVRGLELRVTDNKKTWCIRYRLNGRQRRYTIGPFPRWSVALARKEANRILREVDSGRDPQQAKMDAKEAAKVEKLTYGKLVERYLAYIQKPRSRDDPRPRKKSWKGDMWMLEKDVLPLWRHREPASITRREVRELLEHLAETAPIQSNRVLEVIRIVFNWALEREIIDVNPASRVKKLGIERSRDRVLSDDEMLVFWYGLEGVLPTMATAHRLRLVTGQRGGEVFEMRWSDLDLESSHGPIWSIPAHTMKSNRPHVAPLSSFAVDLIRTIPQRDGYVFRGARGKRQRYEAIRAIGIPNFQGHDLRRTAASGMAALGVTRFVVARILGHADTEITAVYDHYQYLTEKRAGLERWGEHLRRLVIPEDET